MGKLLFVVASILVCEFCIEVTAQLNYVGSHCDGSDFNYTQGSAYENNINLLFTKLTPKTSTLKFYNDTAGEGSNKVYGLYQCRNDVRLRLCSDCVQDATDKIIGGCPLTGVAVAYYYECTLWYSNNYIFSSYESHPGRYRWGFANVSDYAKFMPIFANEMDGVIKNASSSPLHFASSETKWTLFDHLYSFAQCTPNLDFSGCNSCLKLALTMMSQRSNASVRAMMFFPSCQLRYDTTAPFLNDLSTLAPPPAPIDQGPSPPKKPSTNPAVIGAIAGGVGGVLLIVLPVAVFFCFCRKKPKEESRDTPSALSPPKPPSLHRHDDGCSVKSEAESLGDREFLQYDFKTLKIATRDFSAENKLGEGGFGSVYKGTLDNGEQLAIKRLSGTSGQGTKEFMTEARLLAKLQHRNLVKLVGFCSEGEEKLLVYEFMSNASLDGFLFDAGKRPLLDWVTRHKIITGIARGLQYLHEDSRLTIIHRDLKPGNILLDKEMNPKIADFGLAKLFEVAQRFGNTSRIAGTLGYMAPEYMTTGEYSDKSDVYSFGIMLLEIVSGQNNIKFYKAQQMEDLPVHAWVLWNEERSYELTDPSLLNNCSSKEVIRCIQIGLLCLQANAEERPKMALVAVMLTSSVDLPLPSAPAMSFPQFNMPIAYSGGKQSDTDQYFTKSDTLETDVTQDLHPQPR